MELEIKLEGIGRLQEAFRVMPGLVQRELLGWAHEQAALLQHYAKDGQFSKFLRV